MPARRRSGRRRGRGGLYSYQQCVRCIFASSMAFPRVVSAARTSRKGMPRWQTSRFLLRGPYRPSTRLRELDARPCFSMEPRIGLRVGFRRGCADQARHLCFFHVEWAEQACNAGTGPAHGIQIPRVRPTPRVANSLWPEFLCPARQFAMRGGSLPAPPVSHGLTPGGFASHPTSATPAIREGDLAVLCR